MVERNRCWRRAQRNRLRDKRFHYFNAFYCHQDYLDSSVDDRNHRLGRMVKTPKPCSCIGCGNPRKLRRNDDPMQEKVAKDKCKNAYREWNQVVLNKEEDSHS